MQQQVAPLLDRRGEATAWVEPGTKGCLLTLPVTSIGCIISGSNWLESVAESFRTGGQTLVAMHGWRGATSKNNVGGVPRQD